MEVALSLMNRKDEKKASEILWIKDRQKGEWNNLQGKQKEGLTREKKIKNPTLFVESEEDWRRWLQ